MELAQAIKKRRTIHIFSKKSVPREVIEKSIVAANQAPCHRRTFPWRFTNIGIKKRELLYQLQLTLKFGDMTVDQSSLKKIRDKMLILHICLLPLNYVLITKFKDSKIMLLVLARFRTCHFHLLRMMLDASGQQEKSLKTLIPIKLRK